MSGSSRQFPRLWFRLLTWGLAMGVGLGAAGCGGQGAFTLDEGALAQRYLPPTRSVDHSPDSLRDLTVTTEEDSTISFEMKNDYASLWQKWSASYQNLGSGRSRRSRSYATLWSKELSLASLQPEMGIQGLSPDRAHDLLDQRHEEYRKSIQIDVFWFEAEGSSTLAGPGARVFLQVGDEEYRPREEDYGPLREAFLEDASTGLYRRNTFLFPRVVDEQDILDGATQLTLLVRHTGRSERFRFRWTWDASQAAVRGAGMGPAGALVADGS